MGRKKTSANTAGKKNTHRSSRVRGSSRSPTTTKTIPSPSGSGLKSLWPGDIPFDDLDDDEFDDDVPGPDVNTGPQVMSWMLDTYVMHKRDFLPGVITGKPLELGGSAGRHNATSRGLHRRAEGT